MIKALPAADCLRLAVLVLNDISSQSVVDNREMWTEDDLQGSTSQAGHILIRA